MNRINISDQDIDRITQFLDSLNGPQVSVLCLLLVYRASRCLQYFPGMIAEMVLHIELDIHHEATLNAQKN